MSAVGIIAVFLLLFAVVGQLGVVVKATIDGDDRKAVIFSLSTASMIMLILINLGAFN